MIPELPRLLALDTGTAWFGWERPNGLVFNYIELG
jgi:hypothetical protein